MIMIVQSKVPKVRIISQKLKIGVTEYLVLTDDDLDIINTTTFSNGIHQRMDKAKPIWDKIDGWKGKILIISSRHMAAAIMKIELWSRVYDTFNCFVLHEKS